MSLSSFRVQPRRDRTASSASTEKSDEHPPPRGRGRMSLSSFRVHQDATGQQSSASTEKSDEHPPPSVCGRMSLSSFRVHKTRPDRRVVPRRKK
ncbi:hypothetical protein TNCV_4361801 [Trichonephila clavipes]|nr:hypothetical protein TNCV_4361801 [Trichonephila clavipes]